MSHKEKRKSEVNVLERSTEKRTLMLYNDDYHTFDYVIEALMEICEHNTEQAVQCTYLVHYKGKADVKSGNYDYLKPMMQNLRKKDLKAVIE